MARLLTDDEVMKAAAPAMPGQGAPGRLLSDDEIMAPPSSGKARGAFANFTGQANDMLASVAGFPADVVNAISYPARQAAGWVVDQTLPMMGIERTDADRAEAERRSRLAGGSDDIRSLMEGQGITTLGNTEAQTGEERAARAAGAGVVSTLVPYGAARTMMAGGVARAPGAVRTVLEALGAGGLVGNTAAGAAAGVAGSVAGDQVDDPRYKPLAQFGGEIAGGGLAAVGISGVKAGARAAGDALQSLTAPMTQGGRGRMVADTLRQEAADPMSLGAALDDAAPLVPGSRPTTYQASGDAGIGVLERGAATRDPSPFLDRRAAQNAARTEAVGGLAPAGRPDAVRDLFKRQLDQTAAGFDQQIAKATTARGAAVDRMGAAVDSGAAGGAMRDALGSVKAAEKAALSKLYDAVDPDGALALSIAPLKAKARELVRDLPKASALGADESRILGTLRDMPDVERFGEMTALRSELLSSIRAERFTRGETPALRRMTMLRQSVDDLIADAADAADGGASRSSGGLFDTPPASPAAPGGGAAAPAMGDKVYTPSGQSVGVRYEVVEASKLYPASGPLQPRDRSRAASDVQIRTMAQNLQPERLGASVDGATGAPIVGPDGIIESGNGRVAAIRQAYGANGPSGGAYRDWLSRQYPEAANMREPVLVRRRTDNLPMQDRARLVQEWNSNAGLSFSATEKAVMDADRMSPAVLSLYRGGDLTAPDNVPFMRAFMQSVAGKGEVNALASGDGRLSAEGLRRVRTALLQKAYQDGGIVSALAETGDDGIRAIGEGLTDAAPAWSLLREGINAGRVRPEMDITPAVLDAVRLVQSARSKGMPLADAAAQVDAFNAPAPEALQLLRAVYGEGLTGRASRRRMADLLTAYADEAGKASADPGLLLDLPDVMPADILQTVGARYDRTQGQPAGVGGIGAGSGTGGAEGRGFGPAAASPADAGGRGASTNLTEETLSPNFDADAAGRYRAASDGYRGYADRFKGGPVGAALRVGPGGQGFNLSDTQVASKFWNGGKRAADDVQAFRAAVGNDRQAVELLSAEAGRSLRDAAVKPDGSLDSNRWARWIVKHKDAFKALEAMPGGKDVVQRFRAPAKAQAMVDSLTADRARSLDDVQKSAARFFLERDPVDAVAAAFRSKNAPMDIRDLVKRIGGDKEAKAGLQRAVVEFIKRDLTGNTDAGDGVSLLKSDQFQTWVKRNRTALRQAFTEDQVKGMENIAADLRRSNLSTSGAKLPGGSNAAQDAFAATKGRAGSVLQHLMAGGLGAGAGATVGGPVGAIGGAIAVDLAAMARNAGKRKVDALLTEALLDPELAAKLLRQYPSNARTPMPLRDELSRRLLLVGTGVAVMEGAN